MVLFAHGARDARWAEPFEAVAAVSEFNQRAYELFAQPLVQASADEFTATWSERSRLLGGEAFRDAWTTQLLHS